MTKLNDDTTYEGGKTRATFPDSLSPSPPAVSFISSLNPPLNAPQIERKRNLSQDSAAGGGGTNAGELRPGGVGKGEGSWVSFDENVPGGGVLMNRQKKTFIWGGKVGCW